MVLPFLNRDDVVILISLRGEGELINEFASQLRLRSIKTISMTRLKIMSSLINARKASISQPHR